MNRNFKRNIFPVLVFAILAIGCATMHKPPHVVVKTVEQQGVVLEHIRDNFENISKEELHEALLLFIESNKALKRYLSTEKETENERPQDRIKETRNSDTRAKRTGPSEN